MLVLRRREHKGDVKGGMKKGKEEERGCCPDRFSASIDRQWVGKTDKLWPWWIRGGGGFGRVGELDWVDVGWMVDGWWMVDGGNMGRIGGKREAQQLRLDF